MQFNTEIKKLERNVNSKLKIADSYEARIDKARIDEVRDIFSGRDDVNLNITYREHEIAYYAVVSKVKEI